MTFVILMKQWIKHHCNIVKSTVRIRFLKFCLQRKIVPTHLYRIHKFELKFFELHLWNKYYKLKNFFIYRMLNTELNDSYRLLHYSRIDMYFL